MAKKARSVKGLKNFRYCIITENEDGTLTYGAIKTVPGMVEVKLSTDESLDPQYGDDDVYDVANSIGATNGEFTFNAIPLEQRAELSGLVVEDGMVKFNNNANPPLVACSFEGPKNGGGSMHVGLYKGQGSVFTSEEWKTKADKTELVNEPWNCTFMPIDASGNIKVVGDSTHAEFSMAKFDAEIFGTELPTV
ncbi:hypothetical protein QUF79_14635 [Fictibacillus enclensis]|uniref:major tail protein n=1 Tax=Fictibacillus enclensis TaxID=1017270 RepID=UPI0025A26738|nr:major tail protein [Fictibacillus enclensis]MDM5199255.1 hypothetical protein [Fictibacillus enclensis]